MRGTPVTATSLTKRREIEGRPDCRGEHQVVLLPRCPTGKAPLCLAGAVLTKGANANIVERDGPAATGRLGLCDARPIGDGHNGLTHVQHGAGEVHIRPAQAQELAASHPRV